jgi:hypothetical protein
METFKVAICLSGQPRYWNIAAKNIKKYFESEKLHTIYHVPIEYHYFIHTWDINTWRYPKTHHTHFYDEKTEDVEGLKNEFNPKLIVQEKWNKDKFIKPWDSLFYSFYRSLLLKREYEIENKFEYNVVVKARLDIIYNPNHTFNIHLVNPGFNGLVPGMCYNIHPINKFPNEFNYNCFDDVLFFGDSRTMDMVGSLYHSFQKTIENNIHNEHNLNPSYRYGPGTLLYEHMMNLGVHPEMSFFSDYCVIRSTALNGGELDSVINYNEFKRKSIDWYGNF